METVSVHAELKSLRDKKREQSGGRGKRELEMKLGVGEAKKTAMPDKLEAAHLPPSLPPSRGCLGAGVGPYPSHSTAEGGREGGPGRGRSRWGR
jgi:hypothetical protein